MKNIFIILILLMGSFVSCNAQKKENTMTTEKYDFEAVKNAKRYPVGIKRNGSTILMFPMIESGAFYNEYPPIPIHYWIQKTFYPNGEIKTMGKLVGRILKIGEWIYYDEKGNITKVDEDKKFGKIKLENLLQFLEKEGHINLQTGEGFETAIVHENGQGEIRSAKFDIYGGENNGKECWAICIYWAPWNQNTETIYHIDKDTGEVLHKESQQIFPIM